MAEDPNTSADVGTAVHPVLTHFFDKHAPVVTHFNPVLKLLSEGKDDETAVSKGMHQLHLAVRSLLQHVCVQGPFVPMMVYTTCAPI